MTFVNGSRAKLSSMTIEDARQISMRLFATGAYSAGWIAREIPGSYTRQAVHSWFAGTRKPADPNVWVEIATLLQLNDKNTVGLLERAFELSLDVLQHGATDEVRGKASSLIKDLKDRPRITA